MVLKLFRGAYFIHGAAISKDEVDRTLNVTLLEVMASHIVAERVLRAVEPAPGEVRLVTRYPKRHRLPSLHPRHRSRCCILLQTRTH